MFIANFGALFLTPFLMMSPFLGANGDAANAEEFFAQLEANVEGESEFGNWFDEDWFTNFEDMDDDDDNSDGNNGGNDNNDRPHIDSIDPEEGEAGSEVTLTGDDFTDNSIVRFGRETIDEGIEVSDDGETLTFTVPEDAELDDYRIRVINEDDEDGRDLRSNRVGFEVIENGDDDDDDNDNGTTTDELAIASIDGPTGLEVGEEGTWTVNVENHDGENLTYAVKWGDEGFMPLARLMNDDNGQASATFTHTYDEEGTFTPEFTVTDEDGNEVTEDADAVTVGDGSDEDVPVLDSIDPSSAEAGDEVTLAGSGFDANSRVFVNGDRASSTVESDTEITLTVPDLDEGDYRVVVRDDDGRSDALRLTVLSEGQSDDGHVSISGISAPTSLEVGEEGTWTVNVDSELEGNLTYSVVWGDEPMSIARVAAETQSSATFTHIYQQEGDYDPRFTVTDENGNSADVSASVAVVDDSDDDNDENDDEDND